jgi:hypothetical protein
MCDLSLAFLGLGVAHLWRAGSVWWVVTRALPFAKGSRPFGAAGCGPASFFARVEKLGAARVSGSCTLRLGSGPSAEVHATSVFSKQGLLTFSM